MTPEERAPSLKEQAECLHGKLCTRESQRSEESAILDAFKAIRTQARNEALDAAEAIVTAARSEPRDLRSIAAAIRALKEQL